MNLPAAPASPARASLAELAALLPALAVYLAVAIPMAAANAERLNPDGVCYLRLAQYLAAGQWVDGISLYWSPALPLSAAPLVALGMDAIDAARAVLLAWGAVSIAATGWFLREWTPLARPWRAAWLVLLALPAAGFQIFVIAPDVILSAVLLAYFAALRRAARRGHGWGWAGALGGLAFFAKAYALPFVALHLPLSVWWLHRRPPGAPSAARRRALLAATAAFLVPVAAWTAVLSAKNGVLTFGKSGAINHAVAGPPDVPRYHPVVFGVPTPPHISVWETPEQLSYQPWSPFASREYFLHQAGLATDNAWGLLRTATELDGVCLLALAALTLPLAARQASAETVRKALRTCFPWLAGTLLLYGGGYLLVAYEPRYVRSLLFPLLLAATAGVASSFPDWRWRAGLLAALVGSVAWTWIPVTARSLGNSASPWLREVAAEMRQRGLDGRFAATSWYHGLATAFFSGQPHVGFPPDADPARVGARLREANVDWLLVFQLPVMPPMPVQDLYPPTNPRALAMVQNEGWEMRAALRVRQGGGEAHVLLFHRPAAAAAP